MAESRELGYAESYMHLLQAMICGNGQTVCAIRFFSNMLQVLSALSRNTPFYLPSHSLKPPIESLLQNPLPWDEFLANKTASQAQPELLAAWRYHRNAPYDRRQASFNLGFSCSNMSAPAVQTACEDHRIKAFYILASQPAGNFPMILNAATLSGEMFCTFLYTHPLMSEDWAARYVDEFMKIIQGSLG